MKILTLSDTHGRHSRYSDLPGADVFLHAGDFTRYGSGAEEFAMWFHRLPYKLKLLTLGNHELKDSVAKPRPEHWHSLFGPMALLDRGIRAKIGERELVVFGLPSGTKVREIPHVDIVLSHDPPYKILDRTRDGGHAGSEEIARIVADSHPNFHVFGHVHAQGGERTTTGAGITYVNAATRAVLFEFP